MDKGIQKLEELIRFAGLRHKVLASNVANADTPGYRAKDVRFPEELKSQMVAMTRTDGRHLGGGPSASGSAVVVPVERSPWGDGNNVALDAELGQMTENALLYEAAVRLLSKKILMYKSAVKAK